MSVYDGDYLGFSIGDVHSKNLNITRVSSGNRYIDNLIPNFKDATLEVPGVDGIYYWDTKYSNRTFTIDFAYDYLGDNDIRSLRKLFGFRGVQPLIFDEFPYKKYMVRCQGQPNLKYICFTDENIRGSDFLRVFKGEGSVNLVAYYPFGISTETFSYTWEKLVEDNKIIFNGGDLEADFYVYYNIQDLPFTDASGQGFTFTLTNQSTGDFLKVENLKNIGTMNSQGNRVKDYYLLVNTKTHLLEGLNQSFQKTGNLYNRFTTTGDFFKLQVDNNEIDSSNSSRFVKLEYNRIYY